MSAIEGRPEPPRGRDDREGSWSGERDTILPEEQPPAPQTPPEPPTATADEAGDDPDTARPRPE